MLGGRISLDSTGRILDPHPTAPAIHLDAALLRELTADPPPPSECLFLWRCDDLEMGPTIPLGAWVLLDTSPSPQSPILDHHLYLLRIADKASPILRRLAFDSLTKCHLAATEMQGRVPKMLAQEDRGIGWSVLAHACWVGVRLPD